MVKYISGPKKEIGFYNDLKISDDSLIVFWIFKTHLLFFIGMVIPLICLKVQLDLASSEHYQNQAFQYKSAVGLQFHLEVNEEMVNLWLDNTEEKLEKIPYIDPKNPFRY